MFYDITIVANDDFGEIPDASQRNEVTRKQLLYKIVYSICFRKGTNVNTVKIFLLLYKFESNVAVLRLKFCNKSFYNLNFNYWK